MYGASFGLADSSHDIYSFGGNLILAIAMLSICFFCIAVPFLLEGMSTQKGINRFLLLMFLQPPLVEHVVFYHLTTYLVFSM